ncbi:MAG: fibronectin type III domain-containing protein [Patescibacteria group bacterium]
MKKIILILIGLFIANFVIGSESTIARYVAQSEQEHSTFDFGCWEEPAAPEIVKPVPVIDREGNQALQSEDMVISWLPSEPTCDIAELQYAVEIFTVSDETLTLYERSDWQATFSHTISDVPEGEYRWQILVRDQYGNEETTGLQQLTIDRTQPTAEIFIENSAYDEMAGRIVIYTPEVARYRIEARDTEGGSGIASVEYRFQDGEWISGDEFDISEGIAYVEVRATDYADNSYLSSPTAIVTDTRDPSVITDLRVEPGYNTADVTWSAPFDNDPSGVVAGYDIRYATEYITPENFSDAQQLSQEVEPGEYGSLQKATITGLEDISTYYVAIRTIDKAGNRSAISQPVQFTTDIDPSTPLLNAAIDPQSSTLTFSVDNTSTYTSLEYHVTYLYDGTKEGVQGLIQLNGEASVTRDSIVLGTCSTNECILHSPVSDITVMVTLTDTHGEKIEVNTSL